MSLKQNSESTRDSAEVVSAYLWILFAVCFLGNVVGGATSTLMSVYLPDVVKDLLGNVDNTRFNEVSAYITALFFVGWAFGGFSWGVIGDRIGRSRSLAMSVAMFGLFTLMTSFTSSWKAVVVFRFLSGFGIGGMLVINTTLLSETWPQKSRAIVIGILSVGFPVGIFSSGAINYLVSDWHKGFMIGMLPLGIGILSSLFLRESEKWQSSRSGGDTIKPEERTPEHRVNLINGAVVFGCMLIGLWAIFSWLPTWVQSIVGDRNGQSERSIAMMLLGAGGLTGGFLSGWVSNGLGTRRAMIMCFSGCFVLSFLLFKTNTEFTTITLIEIALLSFLFGISQGLLSVYIPLLFPVHVRAASTGFCFNIGRFFTAAAVFFVGALVIKLGGYGNSLFTFSFVFFIGFVMLLLSKKIAS
jgi:predicted MFS family arabinose efflux permease